MTKKISLLIVVALIFAALITLSSCSLIGGNKPDVPDDGGTSQDKPGDGTTDDGTGDKPSDEKPDDGEKPDDKEPEVDLSGITLPPYTGVYDGKAHSLSISGTLPEGVTVAYLGNGVRDAGTYEVSARFYLNGAYLAGKDVTSTITIEKATYDMSGIRFDGATLIGGGAAYELSVWGELPAGVSVLRYDGNGNTEVGEHTVTAVFKYDEKNYEPIPDMTATLRVVEGPSKFAGIALPDMTRVFDGKTYTVTTEGISATKYDIEYTANSARAAGEYEVLARIFDGTDEVTLSSSLTVEPAVLDVRADDVTVDYDGEVHSIVLEWANGKRPVGISVTEQGNSTVAIGSHDVRFRFHVAEEERGNYVYHPDIHATLTIKYNADMVTSDGLVFQSVAAGYAVVGYTGTATQIIIPSEYTNSLNVRAKVCEISAGAFMGNESITYVYMPNSITKIGHNAFRGCKNLEAASIGDYVKTIGSLAFSETAISDVVLPDTLQAIGQGAYRGTPVERITLPFLGGSKTTSNPYIGYIFGASAYAGNELYVPAELKTVILSERCTLVNAYSFFGASSVEEIILSEKVKEIGISAFQGCTSLIGIYIPKTVTDIPAAATYYNSPVYGCAEGFTIGTGIADKRSIPDGWGSRWDILSDVERASVVYNVSYEEYLEAIRGGDFYVFEEK